MYGDRRIKKLLEGMPGGGRKGKSYVKVEDIEMDLKNIGVMRHRIEVANWIEYALIVRAAKGKFKKK